RRSPDRGLVHRLLQYPGGGLEYRGHTMHAKAKLFGHPIHQMLIVFPLGLLATSLIFDIAYHATGNGRWGDIAYVMISCGIIGGLGAAVFGLVELVEDASRTRGEHTR